MTSAERIAAAVSHQQPDRVPFILPVMLHGAKLLGLPLPDYFKSAEAMAEAQLRLQQRYGHDAIVALPYAALEHEAWGGTTIFYDDGPPNAGLPVLRTREDIGAMRVPVIEECPGLQRMLATIRIMKRELGDSVPIVGAVVAPNSVPIMQLGFERYLNLVLDDREGYAELMRANEAFTLAWARKQIEAGAGSIAYFDPVSSPTVMPRSVYRETGWPVARRMIAAIGAPVFIGLASGRATPILNDVAEAGAVGVGVSADDNLEHARAITRGRLTIMGNLNGVVMRKWSTADASAAVRSTIESAGPGGGFVLSEHHGEVPYQVPDEVLCAISDAVDHWGRAPDHA